MPSSPLSLQSCKARDPLDLKAPGPAGGVERRRPAVGAGLQVKVKTPAEAGRTDGYPAQAPRKGAGRPVSLEQRG